MVLETIADVFREKLTATRRLAHDLFARSVRPIFLARSDHRPELIGTGVLIEVDHALCLSTAAHVVRRYQDQSLYLGGMPRMIRLDVTFDTTLAKDGNPDSDHVDVAAVHLPASVSAELADVPFVKATHHRLEPDSQPGNTYMVMGYRVSQNKVPRPDETVLRSKLWKYTGISVPVPGAERRFANGAHNFAVDFTKFGERPSGERVKNTPPEGVSGGAMIHLGNMADPELLAGIEQYSPRLVGTFIECWQGALIGTKLNTVYDVIRRGRSS